VGGENDMNQEELNKLAKDIITKNIYLTLSTADNNTPWAAPLFYCTDKNYNFYYISQMDSLHTRHILKNAKVAFAIFDSHAEEGQGNGVQGSGSAHLLEEEVEIKEALKHYHTTFIDCKFEDFTGERPYRLFKIVPDKFYVLEPDADVDKRVEVSLE
jgi:uncharacterized protein YhbP (UPF0306 family)